LRSHRANRHVFLKVAVFDFGGGRLRVGLFVVGCALVFGQRSPNSAQRVHDWKVNEQHECCPYHPTNQLAYGTTHGAILRIRTRPVKDRRPV
jgi:hypothetical protein